MPSRTQLVVASVAVLALGGSATAIAVSTGQTTVTCTIDSNIMTCPLPPAETVTSTVTQPPVTQTVTATADPTTATPSTTTTTVPVTTTTTATPTTTTATTTATTPPPTGCAARPNASNTGAQGTLANYTGPTTITTAGAVIQNVQTSSDLTISAANVTIKNVKAAGISVLKSGPGARISNVTVGGIYSSSGSNIAIDKANIGFTSGGDSIHITSDSGVHIVGFTLTNSWIHDPRPGPAEHWDGIQVRGADNSLVQCNAFDLGAWKEPINSAVYFEAANGGNNNIRIDKNWLGGGGFAIYMGTHGPGYAEVTNNVFGPNLGYGNCYDSANPNWLPTLMKGNVDTTGKAIDPVCVDR
jgi:hypothetical protein